MGVRVAERSRAEGEGSVNGGMVRHVMHAGTHSHGVAHCGLRHGLTSGRCVIDRAEDARAEGWVGPGVVVAGSALVVGRRWCEGALRGVVKDRDILGADHLCCNRSAQHRLGEGVGILRGGGIVRAVLACCCFELERLRHGVAA